MDPVSSRVFLSGVIFVWLCLTIKVHYGLK